MADAENKTPPDDKPNTPDVEEKPKTVNKPKKPQNQPSESKGDAKPSPSNQEQPPKEQPKPNSQNPMSDDIINKLESLFTNKLQSFKSEIEGKIDSLSKAQQDAKDAKAKQDADAKSAEEKKQSDLNLKSLQTEIKDLKSQIAEKEARISTDQRNNSISQYFSKKGLSASKADAATKLFLSDYASNLAEQDGSWYYKQGDEVSTIDNRLDSFLKDQKELFFPENSYTGLGLSNRRPQAPNKKEPQLSLNERLFLPDDE